MDGGAQTVRTKLTHNADRSADASICETASTPTKTAQRDVNHLPSTPPTASITWRDFFNNPWLAPAIENGLSTRADALTVV